MVNTSMGVDQTDTLQARGLDQNDPLQPVFERASEPSAHGSSTFLPGEWDSIRDSGIIPRFSSPLNESQELRDEFIGGATALGLVGRRKVLQPQQLLLVDVLNSGCKFTSVLMPRRSTKTTTLLAWMIGRCLAREDYLAVYGVMTSAKKSRDRFTKDVVQPLERIYPEESERPFKIVRANGQERLTFKNGSVLQFAGPSGTDYRSDAYDLIVFDESGEADPETGEDVLASALPTMDTRPDGMIVVAGTAAKYREGNLLWDELTKGRAEEPRHAILDFSVDDELEPDLSTWEAVLPLVLTSHPGVGGLTPIASVEDNYKILKERFPAEYLGIFGRVGTSSFINLPKWETLAERGRLPAKPPEIFRIGISVHLLQRSASITAAWRDADGRAHIGVIDHRDGDDWLYARALAFSRKYRVPIVYDFGSAATQTVVERLTRARPAPKLEKQTWPQVSTAAALMVSEIESGNVVHYGQPVLTEAVRVTTKRGTAKSARWALGVKIEESEDNTALVAGSLALRAVDEVKPRQPLVIVSE
jgi:hypothetical protein